MRRRSLTTRLTLSHLLATLVGLLLLGGSLVWLVGRSQQSEALAGIERQAEVVAAYAASIASDTATLGAQAGAIANRFPAPIDVAVRIFAVNGSALYTTQELRSFPSSQARVYMEGLFVPPAVGQQRGRLYAAVPVQIGSQTIGIVEVSQSREREQRLIGSLLVGLLGAGAIALLGALVLGTLLARSLTKPLHKLGDVTSAIAAGDLTTRSSDRSRDEIGQLADQINGMAGLLEARLEQVEELAASRQQFYRSVSHELRTPLTAIRGMAENLEDDATPEQQTALQVIQTETARLQRLVEELLQPGQAAMAPMRQKEPVDLAALIDECCALLQGRAERGGVTLRCTFGEAATIKGDRDRLKQALLNLLDNALKWTPAGGRILLTSTRTGQTVTLSVRDSGPGIPTELRPQVWQRGVHGADGGQGFGLALVREVVEAHGGQVRLLDEPGTVIMLSLPEVRG